MNEKCEICGKRDKVECKLQKRNNEGKKELKIEGIYVRYRVSRHHIIPQRFDDSLKEKKTISVCRQCHSGLHKLIIDTAIWKAIKENPKFFEEVLREFINLSKI